MSNNFNLENYIKLLNKQKQDLTKIEQDQLFFYQVSLEYQVAYNRREEYFSLIKEYLANNIDPQIFRVRFLEMQKQDCDTAGIIEKDFEQLSNFSIDFKLRESPFSDLLDVLYNCSMLAIEEGPEEGISDDEFRISVENAFSKLSKDLGKE